MCGIIAIIHGRSNGFDFDAKNALVPMLLLNSLRGVHSTGLLGVEKDKDRDRISFVKKIGSPYNLLAEEKTKEFFDAVFHRFHAVIGHGRYATAGKITAGNSHPFIHGNIALVHNGVVRNIYDLKVKGESLLNKFEVDSEALAYMFSEVGVLDTLKEVTGAFSLMWHDAKTRAIHAIRNDERPLFITLREDVPGIFFSSEKETIVYVANKFPTMKFGEIMTLAPGHLYTFPLGTNEKSEYDRKKIQLGKTYEPVWGYQNRSQRRWDSQNAKWIEPADFGMYGDMNDLFPDRTTTSLVALPSPKKTTSEVVSSLLRKEKNKGISDVSISGVSFKLGRKIAFFPEKIVPIPVSKGGKESCFIEGRHVIAEDVMIGAHVSGKIKGLHNEVVLAGTIAHMSYQRVTSGIGYNLRVFLKDIDYLSEEVQNKVCRKEMIVLEEEIRKHPSDKDDCSGVSVSVMGGVKYTLHQFEREAEKGCAKCSGSIEITDANLSLPVIDHSTATPEERAHGGLYCPDCVIHYISH